MSCPTDRIWCLAQCRSGDISEWMEDKVLRIVVGLRIDAPLVQPLVCCHCGEQVDVKGIHHGQSCPRSPSCYPRHAFLNGLCKSHLDLIKPNGRLRSSGKLHMALVWRHGGAINHCVGCHMPRYLFSISIGFGWC